MVKVFINNQYSQLASQSLLSFKLVDNSNLTLDSLELIINNVDNEIPIPQDNATIEIEVNDVSMGKFNATYVNASPLTINIMATSANLTKARNTNLKSFTNTTLKDVLQSLAKDLDLTLQGDDILNTKIEYFLQNNQTALECIANLHAIFNSIVAIKDDNLIFLKPQSAKEITITDIMLVNKQQDYKAVYSGVQAIYWSTQTAKQVVESKGNPPYLNLPNNIHKSLINTYLATQMQQLQNTNFINVVALGNPNINAGFNFNLQHPLLGGKYHITKAIHNYSNTYTTKILAYKV